MDKNSRVTVEPAQFVGVDVTNPTIVRYIKNFARMRAKGDTKYDTAYIAKVVGMPHSVVRRYEDEVKKELAAELAQKQDFVKKS